MKLHLKIIVLWLWEIIFKYLIPGLLVYKTILLIGSEGALAKTFLCILMIVISYGLRVVNPALLMFTDEDDTYLEDKIKELEEKIKK